MERNFFADLVTESLSVDDKWENVVLFEPYENEQALLYQYADCLSSRTLLKMCSLPYRVEQRPNAEFMSPTGRVPFLKVGERLVADFLPIVEFVAKKGVKLSDSLTDVEIAQMTAHICIIDEVLRSAEMYVVWLHKATFNTVTKLRYGSVYPWPLSSLLPMIKRREIGQRLGTLGWANRSLVEVFDNVDRCCRCLSTKLGENNYFCGENPTELDALVFGHLYTILTTELPSSEMATIVKRYQNLVKFCKRIDSQYYSK